nr:class I SAM-dependent methyltransferase [Chiayiivirga flava]
MHSCGHAFAGNYAGAVAAFWQGRFAACDDGALILDVGTGNGAIPRLALDHARRLGRQWRIHGADIAAIDPAQVGTDAANYAPLQFHPGVSMARLPFDDGSVDLITGQYALEYTDIDASVREFARVLRRGGGCAFVLHRTGSVVLRATDPQLDDCRFLFVEARLYQRARELATYLARANTAALREQLAGDVGAQRARAKLNESADAVLERIERSAVPGLLQTAMAHIGEAFGQAHVWGEAKTREFLAWSEQALRDEEARLRHLRAAALDDAGVQALGGRFAAHGFVDVAIGELVHAADVAMGWTLAARRA